MGVVTFCRFRRHRNSLEMLLPLESPPTPDSETLTAAAMRRIILLQLMFVFMEMGYDIDVFKISRFL